MRFKASKPSMPGMRRSIRTQGFSSDQQVWQALRERTGYAVIQYDARVHGLPAASGFAPFRVEIPDSADVATAHYHTVTIIGLMPASSSWRILMSVRTAGSVVQPPYIQFVNTYLFRLRAGVGEAQATSDLNRTLDAARRGITCNHSTMPASTASPPSSLFSWEATLRLASFSALSPSLSSPVEPLSSVASRSACCAHSASHRVWWAPPSCSKLASSSPRASSQARPSPSGSPTRSPEQPT